MIYSLSEDPELGATDGVGGYPLPRGGRRRRGRRGEVYLYCGGRD